MTTRPSSTSPLATSSDTMSVCGRVTFDVTASAMPRRSSTAAMCRPLPTGRKAIDLASSRVRLNASTEPISGFRAPARTSTPMPERARSMRVVATIFPCVIQVSTGADPLMTRSHVSPAAMRRSKSAGRPLET